MATKKRGRAVRKAKQDGTSAPVAGSPLPMTQREIEALAAGATVTDLDKRLRAHSPSKRSVKAKQKSNKLAPIPLSAAEMATLKKSGKLSRSMQERFEKAAKRDVSSIKKIKKQKEEPNEPPSYKRG